MTLSVQEINQAISFGNFTSEQLTEIARAITYRRSRILKANKQQLAVGSKVKFTAQGGRTVTGTVEKINRKYVMVKERPNNFNGGVFATNWRVPGHMLTSEA